MKKKERGETPKELRDSRENSVKKNPDNSPRFSRISAAADNANVVEMAEHAKKKERKASRSHLHTVYANERFAARAGVCVCACVSARPRIVRLVAIGRR